MKTNERGGRMLAAAAALALTVGANTAAAEEGRKPVEVTPGKIGT